MKIDENLKGKSAKQAEITRCRAFLKKHKAASKDKVTQINNYISNLEGEVETIEKIKYARKNGRKEYDKIKGIIDLLKYRAFIRNYPKSVYIENLKKRLRKKDKNLPPENHWLSISQNSKSYYERIFANNHRMVYIPEKNFWIDKYEASNAQFRNYKNVNDNDNCPVMVSYSEAHGYCRKYGFRLPTKDEWGYAAGKEIKANGKDRVYPWGNDPPFSDSIFRANFNLYESDTCDGSSPVKSFEKYCSPFGVVNMAGNVWEWVKDGKLKGGGSNSSASLLKIEIEPYQGVNAIRGFRCIKHEIR